MEIVVTSGLGEGATELSAFDAALFDAGVGNYNLIYLSSIVPPGAIVRKAKYSHQSNEIGWKLYCVVSKGFASGLNDRIWVGLGWGYRAEVGGVFIEECGASHNEVKEKIEAAYADMSKSRLNIGNLHIEIIETKLSDRISCGVLIAAFKVENWKS